MKKSYVTWLVIILILFIALLSVRPILFSGATSVHLPPAPILTGQISQALASGKSTSLPVYGRDYNLGSTTYFKDNDWVVTDILGIGENTSSGIAVLQNKNGIYQVVLGPGTAFANTSVQNLPIEVTQYLNQKGAVYESID